MQPELFNIYRADDYCTVYCFMLMIACYPKCGLVRQIFTMLIQVSANFIVEYSLESDLR